MATANLVEGRRLLRKRLHRKASAVSSFGHANSCEQCGHVFRLLLASLEQCIDEPIAIAHWCYRCQVRSNGRDVQKWYLNGRYRGRTPFFDRQCVHLTRKNISSVRCSMAPARDLIDVSTWNLSSSYRQKSRSHLALFETVDRERAHQHRQTEHHNAFGYLGQSIFSRTKTPVVSSASCHQLIRGSPESLFSRLSEAKAAKTSAGRNESSAIFAVMGQGEQPPHSPTNGGEQQLSRSPGQQWALSSPLSEEKVILSPHRHQSPSAGSADNSLSPLHFTVSRPGTALDDYYSKHRINQQPYQEQYPQTSTPLGHHHRHHSKSVFSVPSTMSEKVSITVCSFYV